MKSSSILDSRVQMLSSHSCRSRTSSAIPRIRLMDEWVCMLMKPGKATCPPASRISTPSGMGRLPVGAMRKNRPSRMSISLGRPSTVTFLINIEFISLWSISQRYELFFEKGKTKAYLGAEVVAGDTVHLSADSRCRQRGRPPAGCSRPGCCPRRRNRS